MPDTKQRFQTAIDALVDDGWEQLERQAAAQFGLSMAVWDSMNAVQRQTFFEGRRHDGWSVKVWWWIDGETQELVFHSCLAFDQASAKPWN
jgi:hypothetical protein